MKSKRPQFFPCWTTHNTADEGGNKIHLGTGHKMQDKAIVTMVACGRVLNLVNSGLNVPNLEKWVGGSEDKICKRCLEKAREALKPFKCCGKTPMKLNFFRTRPCKAPPCVTVKGKPYCAMHNPNKARRPRNEARLRVMFLAKYITKMK